MKLILNKQFIVKFEVVLISQMARQLYRIHDNLMFEHLGYVFTYEKAGANDKQLWKCVEYTKKHCLVRFHTVGDQVMLHIDKHNHAPDEASNQVREFNKRLKTAATTSTATPHQIIADSSVGLSQMVSAKISSPKQLKRNILNARKTVSSTPSTPRTLNELNLPPRYTTTLSSPPQQFLLFDSGPGAHRTLIFSTTNNLNLMAESEHWFADGTFKTSPPLFQQIYTIHGVRYNSVIPTAYILMSQRTEEAYLNAFHQLKLLQPRLNPSSIMTDYEVAAINSFRTAFPNTHIRGCFFHFMQSIYRHVQHLGLSGRYAQELEFAHNIKQLGALAFVPVPDVIDSFERLVLTDFFRDNDEVLALVDYFEEMWIGMVRHGRRRPARFDIALWNCYDAVRDGLPKTNNSVEGWHNEFGSLLAANHPSIWKFIEGLQKQQSLNEMKIAQYLAGRNPDEGRRSYRDSAQRILNIVNQYDNYSTLDYVNNLAHNLNFSI